MKRDCSFVVIGGSGRGELVPPRTGYLPLWDSFPGKGAICLRGGERDKDDGFHQNIGVVCASEHHSRSCRIRQRDDMNCEDPVES
jgi:hypothetical protein